jgi:hypothetical protein
MRLQLRWQRLPRYPKVLPLSPRRAWLCCAIARAAWVCSVTIFIYVNVECVCAGGEDYILSSANSRTCPVNYSLIEKEKDCEHAAAAFKTHAKLFVMDIVNFPGYPKGCQEATYGNDSFILLNTDNIGKPNPFGQLLCAKDKPCPPGTYTFPSTESPCKPCEIGTFQSRDDQPSCETCPKGFYGIKLGSSSKADGCQRCPPGTYQGSETSGACSVCAPGTFSNGTSMDRCYACLGPNATARCPGGTAAPYTDAQLELAQTLLPPSLSTLERQCQARPARFVRTAVTSAVADIPKGLSSPAVIGPVAVLIAAAVIVLLLHRFIPEWLWSNVDFTAQFHKVPQGGTSVRENTALGCAFTLAFGLLAPALGIVLHASNALVEANSLIPPGKTIATNLTVLVDLPLGHPGNDTSYCEGIVYINDSFRGMTCDVSGRSMSLSSACTIVLTGCSFIDPSAQLSFSVPWFERIVTWNVSVDSTSAATAHQLSGVVTSGDAAKLISPKPPKKGVLVAIQAQPASLNDTTNANLTRQGFLLNHLPCVLPDDVNTEGWPGSLKGPDLTWQLTLQLRLSPTLYETVRSMKQGPLELALSTFTTVIAVMGVWKTIFSFVEAPVSALRTRLTRRRRMPRERQSSRVELQLNDRKALLARVLTISKPDDSAAQGAVKKERQERQDAVEELDLKMEQMTKKYDDAIRQLSQEVEQMRQELKVAV